MSSSTTEAHGTPERPEAAPAQPSPDARREVLVTLAIVFGLLGVVAAQPVIRRFSQHPSAEQCAAMLDRYAEHLAMAAGVARPAGERAANVEVERCTRELMATEVDCALKANNADEIERCLP